MKRRIFEARAQIERAYYGFCAGQTRGLAIAAEHEADVEAAGTASVMGIRLAIDAAICARALRRYDDNRRWAERAVALARPLSWWMDALYRMRIPADLAVLSACDTGRGAYARGEGVLGLTRGFFHAGVPRLVVSNWKVDDASTRDLMTAFYGRMRDGGAHPLDALRAAQLERIRAGGPAAEPFHWAACTYWGALR